MTRLKSLELFGFKSFADRTRFDFPDGITVVVGPNGSGKSNVVDAIKWVLGEQSARSLRGKEMTDVIFAGSASRKPLNVAEVALVFDNGDGSLPMASADVQIMRRVYRSGESEYLVNGEPSRLRDIRELFSGTGAATEAYSVIEQGRVDALLVASGRDRRAVFEEAAGITRFRVRRAEALRRLERAEADRRRLADIVEEVAKRLDTVRAQAAKARRWKQMTDRLRRLRVFAAGQDLSAIDEEIAGIAGRLATARDELATATADAAAATERAAHVALATEALQPELASRRAEVAAEAQRAAEKASVLAVHRARRTDLESALGRAVADRESARVAMRAAVTSLEQAEAAAATAARELEAIAARLDECTRAAAGSDLVAAERHGRLEAAATALEAVRLERQRLDGERRRAEERAAECRQAAARAHDAVTAQRSRLTRLEESCEACEANVGTIARRIDAAAGAVESLDATLRARGEALETAWAERAGWLARSEACRERRALLQEIVVRHDGVGDAARRLLDGDSARVPGLVGLAADLLVASEQWAPLVDLAIGTRGQSLVVSSLDDAIAWHAGWVRTPMADAALEGGGRVGILAIDTLREPPGFEPPSHPGLVGRLDRLLAAERGDDPGSSAAAPARILAERMLAGVWVVERIEHALPWLAAAPPGTLFMTPAGQCLSADGMFEIGRPSASTGLVARRSELRSLDVRAVELEGQVAAATSRIESLQAEITGLREAVREAHARRQATAEEAAASRSEFDRVRRERAVAREQVAVAEQDVRHAEQALADALAALRVAGDAWAAAAPAVEDAEAAVAVARTDVDELRRGRDEAIEAMHRLRIDEVAGRATLAHGREIVETRRAAVGGCRADLASSVERRDAAAARLDALEMELLAAGAEHAEVVVRTEAAIAALLDAEARHAGLEVERRQAAADGDAAREASSRLSSVVHARELEAGEAGHRRARIVERIRDEYGIEIETAAAETAPDTGEEDLPQDREGLDGAIEELRRKLASITSVNMEALAESEELAERLSGLESQLGDVTSAKEAIEQLIARIDEESRRLLGETIETVRGHFQELFERVFGGGQADIVFEEGVDLLEAAVEIVAHPPGKEPRSISLLSGGEKTMTCVALLLAIFRSRPSPFCVLDEVDAALDEANIDRFVGVLRDFLASTQCIVVTHSKKTMAAATTLYGVTMEESGVSKRISVRFEATAASAGSRAA